MTESSEELSRREKIARRDALAVSQAVQRRDESGRWGINYSPDPRQATPERLAWEAAQRGDRWFQIDITLNVVQGYAYLSQTQTRVYRGDGPLDDFIGKIEDQGWELQHVSTTFVTRGWATTKRLQIGPQTNADDVATHGDMVGLYVFRRREV